MEPYGAGFTRALRRRIRERDRNTCQRCGRSGQELGYTMPVHHLDHDKLNNDLTNFITSCHRCNIWASKHRDEPFISGQAPIGVSGEKEVIVGP